MSISRLWTVLAIALPVLGALLASMSTVDLTYHLRAGAEIIAAGAIPTVDTWTFTAAGEPWLDQQWGAQVVLRVVESVGGWTGLAIARAAAIGLVFGIVALVARRRGLGPRTSALLALAAFVVALPGLALRPQLLGLVCFALVVLVVSERRTRPGLLWLVPVVTLVWANLHGSFFLGPVVVGLAWLEDVADRVARPHRTLLVAIVAAIAACITPFGPMVWAYAIGLSTDPEVTARITEWQPTSLRDVPGIVFFASALGVVALIARRGRAVPWPTLAWLAVFFAIGLYAQRGLMWWGVGAAVGIAGTLIEARPAGDGDRPARIEPPLLRRLNAVVAAALVLAGVVLLPMWRPIEPGTGAPTGLLTDAPPGLTTALRSAVAADAHVFQPQPWGSWFEYAVPTARYAIDSRIELFPPEVWSAYEQVAAGVDGWEDRLAAWEVDLVVVEATETAFRDRLEAAGWTLVAEDADGAVLAAP